MLNGSNLIKGRWKIIKKIGQGAFGEIFNCKNIITKKNVAIKVERVESKKQVLKLEVSVLKKLQVSPFVSRFITCGRYNQYNYMVMELLGENLSDLRRRMPNCTFSLITTLKLGIQMIESIESVHEIGYIHRDIKPSNYVMGKPPKSSRRAYLIDFGLARKYVLPDGSVRPSRESAGFRGTARYASIHSHQQQDLGRRDDLWSVLYILIEFCKGSLPWRRFKDKDKIGEMKIRLNTPELVKDLPHEFLSFMDHLQSLDYADKPDYSFLISLLHDLYVKIGGTDDSPFDWEIMDKDGSVNVNNSSEKESVRNRPLEPFIQPQRGKMIKSGVRLVENEEFGGEDDSIPFSLEHRRIQSFGGSKGVVDTKESNSQQGLRQVEAESDITTENRSTEKEAQNDFDNEGETSGKPKEKAVDLSETEDSRQHLDTGQSRPDTPSPIEGNKKDDRNRKSSSTRGEKKGCCSGCVCM